LDCAKSRVPNYIKQSKTGEKNPSQPEKSIRIENNQTTTLITGVQLNDSISVSTAYLPDKQTLDTLFALPKKYAVK